MEDVKFVVNYDYPNNSEDYIHRIGRTGRSNNTGTAYTLFTPKNAPKANDLIAVLREANQVVNPKLMDLCSSPYSKGRNRGRGGGGGGYGGGRDRQMDRDRFNRGSRMNGSGGGMGGGGGGGGGYGASRDRSRSTAAVGGRSERFGGDQSSMNGGSGGNARENGRPSRFDKPPPSGGSRFGGSSNGNGVGSTSGQLRSFTSSATSNGFSQPPPALMSFTAR